MGKDAGPLRVGLLHQRHGHMSQISAVMDCAASWEQEVVVVLDVANDCDVESSRLAETVANGQLDALLDLTTDRHASQRPVRMCLDRAIPVITANTACVAIHGPTMREMARRSGTQFGTTAAVANRVPGIPALAMQQGGPTPTRVEAFLSPVAATMLHGGPDTGMVCAVDTSDCDVAAHLDGIYCAEAMAALVQWLWNIDLVLDQVARIPADAVVARDAHGGAQPMQWVPAAAASLAGCARVEPIRVRGSHALAGAADPTLVTHNADGAVRTYARATTSVASDIVEGLLLDLAAIGAVWDGTLGRDEQTRTSA